MAVSRPQATLSGAGHVRQGEAKAGVVDDLQRAALEQSLGIGADLAHQGQRFAVGAEQDVLAVVQRAAIDCD